MELPRLIVLRIWAGPARFRAVARELDSNQTRWFADPAELLHYLHGDAALRPVKGEVAPIAQHGGVRSSEPAAPCPPKSS